MEGLKVNEINFDNHINKCRICFKSFSIEEHQIEITKAIEKKFNEITQINLKLTKETSKIICVICSYQLSTISQAKKNMILAQKALQIYLKKLKPKQISTKSQELNFLELDKTEIILKQDDEIIEEHLIEDEQFVSGIAEEIIIKEEETSKNEENFEIERKFYELEEEKNLNSFDKSNEASTNLHPNKFTCHDCGKSFSCGGSLSNHISIYHKISAIELPCSVFNCEKKFKTKKQLTQHLKTHNVEKQVCPECGLLVGNKHNLTKHIKRMHLKMYSFFCDLCDFKGFFKFSIDQHMKKHLDKSERERFYCDECNFESISKMSLRTHKRMEHLGQKKTYICHCGKSFTQSSSYYTHVRVVHQKIKNHSCTFADCNKTFAEKSQLKNHVKSQHLKTRDIPCTQCGKFFATQKHLTAHLKYHRPPSYVCQYGNCGNAFYTSSQLTAHYKVHNNQRDHACHLCDKRYFHRSHLKKHLVAHSNVSVLR